MNGLERKNWKLAKKLYEQGNSMRQVSEKLHTTVDSITYILRKLNVPRRSHAHANALVFKAKVASFTIRSNKLHSNRVLEAMGAMLYFAEGYDTDKAQGVDFANSDPSMIQLFVAFLRSRYVLDEKRMRLHLYAYADQDVLKLKKFWSELTRIPVENFTKPYIRKDYNPDGRRMKYGLIHIRYSDKKLLLDLRKLIESLMHRYCVGGGAVNRTTL